MATGNYETVLFQCQVGSCRFSTSVGSTFKKHLNGQHRNCQEYRCHECRTASLSVDDHISHYTSYMCNYSRCPVTGCQVTADQTRLSGAQIIKLHIQNTHPRVTLKPNPDIFVSCDRVGSASGMYTDRSYLCACQLTTQDLKKYMEHIQTCVNAGRHFEVNVGRAANVDIRSTTTNTNTPISVEFLGHGEPRDCIICDFRTHYEKCYHGHIELHRQPPLRTTDQPFHCPVCPFICSEERYLSPHMAGHISKPKLKTYRCILCDFASTSGDITDCHYEEKHPGLAVRMDLQMVVHMYRCVVCHVKMSSEQDLVDHMSTYHTHADMKTWLKTQFNVSLPASQPTLMYQAARVSSSAISSGYQHRELTDDGNSRYPPALKCYECRFCVGSLREFKAHIRGSHSNMIDKKTVRIFVCRTCTWQTSDKVEMKDHCMKEHRMTKTEAVNEGCDEMQLDLNRPVSPDTSLDKVENVKVKKEKKKRTVDEVDLVIEDSVQNSFRCATCGKCFLNQDYLHHHETWECNYALNTSMPGLLGTCTYMKTEQAVPLQEEQNSMITSSTSLHDTTRIDDEDEDVIVDSDSDNEAVQSARPLQVVLPGCSKNKLKQEVQVEMDVQDEEEYVDVVVKKELPLKPKNRIEKKSKNLTNPKEQKRECKVKLCDVNLMSSIQLKKLGVTYYFKNKSKNKERKTAYQPSSLRVVLEDVRKVQPNDLKTLMQNNNCRRVIFFHNSE